MKLFISHALVDKNLAISFKALLDNTTMGLVTTWLSSAIDGLKPGDNLWNELHQKLSDSEKIIALLTPNSLQRPWILYESGYVAGNKKTNVIPVLFSLEKRDLPLPLSGYIAYSGDDEEDLEQFLTQIIAEIAPLPNKQLIDNSAREFLEKIKPIKESLDILAEESKRPPDYEKRESTKVLDKLKASEIFHQKLADEAVERISILSYTNEVESNTIDHYRVKGEKIVEIFKRSVIDELLQQQRVNLERIKAGKQAAAYWSKRNKILDATARVEKEFSDNENVTVKHYFYSLPPITRAYIFDNNEALVSFYELKENIIDCERSIYKGMGDSESIWVTDETVFGKQLLDGLHEEVKTLRLNSRTWEEEKFLLENPSIGVGVTKMPVLDLRYVFSDLDGVLYDTMPFYVEAWMNGFKKNGIEIQEIDVYEQESKSSEKTVVDLYIKYQNRQPTKDEIAQVVDEKNRVLLKLGKPPVMEGALDLLNEIISSGVKVFIVTSSTRNNLKSELIKDFNNLTSEENIIDGNDVKYGKPNPEPYLIACEKAKCDPSEAVVLENSPLGVTSARMAGLTCVAVNSGLLEDVHLLRHGASAVFQSTQNIAREWANIKRSFDL